MVRVRVRVRAKGHPSRRPRWEQAWWASPRWGDDIQRKAARSRQACRRVALRARRVGIEGLAGVTRALTPTLTLTLTLPLTLTLTLSLSLTWLDEWLTRGLALQGDHEARRGDIQRTGARVGGARRGGCVRVG